MVVQESSVALIWGTKKGVTEKEANSTTVKAWIILFKDEPSKVCQPQYNIQMKSLKLSGNNANAPSFPPLVQSIGFEFFFFHVLRHKKRLF